MYSLSPLAFDIAALIAAVLAGLGLAATARPQAQPVPVRVPEPRRFSIARSPLCFPAAFLRARESDRMPRPVSTRTAEASGRMRHSLR